MQEKTERSNKIYIFASNNLSLITLGGIVKHIVAGFSLTLLILLCSFTSLETRNPFRVRTVVIDAGHGGHDPGTHGKSAKEKDVALKVALALGKTIKKFMPEVKVIYTRTTDKFIELHDRAGLANKNHADLFISIHCNAISNPAIFGTETYTLGLHKSEDNLEVAKRENSVILQEKNHEEKYEGFDPNSPMAHILLANYQSAYIENSLLLASHIETQFHKRVNRKSRGVKQAGFIVLWKTSMPSVLVEIGYLTNQTEERYLTSAANQEFIASGIFRAFRDYKQDIESMND
jgi:N-acetylmuramoyl-L-alanine amidase